MKYSLRSLMPKRRWLQFSLKTLLVGITVLCLGPGGYVVYEQAKARRQKSVVEAIEKLGGRVEYEPTVPVRSKMMRQVLGDDSFGNVTTLNLDGAQVTDAGLVHLAGLTRLENLWLYDTHVTDAGLVHVSVLKGLAGLDLKNTHVTDAGLEELAGLKSLTYLRLDNTLVTDAGLVHLVGMTKLQQLRLNDTRVTKAGVAELQKALPSCKIVRTD